MAKRKRVDHTTFRNDLLFCTHCGEGYKIKYPIPIKDFGKKIDAFNELHRDCIKIWTEPVPDATGKTESENMEWWLVNGERGISSETMFFYISGNRVGKSEGTPSDPDDFSRCYKLLNAIPQWKDKLHLLKKGGAKWSALVDNWDKLTAMYEENVRTDWKNYKEIDMYEFMQSLDPSNP